MHVRLLKTAADVTRVWGFGAARTTVRRAFGVGDSIFLDSEERAIRRNIADDIILSNLPCVYFFSRHDDAPLHCPASE